MAETQRFGFEKFGGAYGGAITDDGGKFSTTDRDTLDRLLTAFEQHRHDADVTTVALDDPTGAPTATVSTTGGTIPGGKTYYYKVSYVDIYGLETAASGEFAISTGAAPNVTTPPILNGVYVAGQTLPFGTYYYALTALSPQGESALGPQAIITVQTTQNGVVVTVPALANGITGYNVWRHGISDAGWTKVGINVTGTTFSDVGVPTGSCLTDPATQPPSTVFGAVGTNSVTVTVPDATLVGTLGGPVRGWRLYRSEASGNYGTSSLVAETVPADAATALATSYTDTGAATQIGGPLLVSTTLTPSRQLFTVGTALPPVSGVAENSFFLNRSTPALYALINGAWAQLSPPPPDVDPPTPGALPLITGSEDYCDLRPVASSGLGIALTQGVAQALQLPNLAENVAISSGQSMSWLSDGGSNINGFKAEAEGEYTLMMFPKVLGLAPGDIVRVLYHGFTVPGTSLSLNYTIPPGVTGAAAADLTTQHPFTARVRCAAGDSIYASITVFSAAAATLDYFDFAMEIEAGTPVVDPSVVPSAVQGLALTATKDLSFTAPASNGSSPLLDYLVSYGSTILTWTTTSGTLSGLPSGSQTVTVTPRSLRGYGAPTSVTATIT